MKLPDEINIIAPSALFRDCLDRKSGFGKQKSGFGNPAFQKIFLKCSVAFPSEQLGDITGIESEILCRIVSGDRFTAMGFNKFPDRFEGHIALARMEDLLLHFLQGKAQDCADQIFA